METKRSHFIAAGVLLLATALAGLAVTGAAKPILPAAPAPARTTFTAPSPGAVTFSGTLDRHAVLVGGDGTARMELVIAAPGARHAVAIERKPTDLMIILDRSGSMSGEKIEQARAAVLQLVSQLGPQDRFSLITYSDRAEVAIPLAPVDERSHRDVAGRVAEIMADGGTNMSSGLDLAIDLIERARASGRVPHVILISDGLANGGDSSLEGLSRRAQRAARGEYVLSTVGVGADFNEYLMHALADAGTGNYYFLESSHDLGNVFAREFDAARTTVASGLAVQIEPGPGVHVVDAAGYPLEQQGNLVTFRPGSLFAGQERRLWVTLGVSSSIEGEMDLGRFSLAYGDGEERTTLRFSETPRIACVRSENDFYAGIDGDAWSRSVLVEGYNAMQEDVARKVKEGRRDEAKRALREFKEHTEAMNARLQSAPVAKQLQSLYRLEAEVDDAFVGADQAAKQNGLSKASSLGAVDARRPGSKK